MHFRNAESQDIESLLQRMRQLYEHDGAPFDETTSRNATLQLLSEPLAGVIQIVEIDNAIAGYFVLTFGFSLEYGGRYGLLDELLIDAEHRDKRLGTSAIHHAQKLCAQRGAATMLLEVDHSNEKATALYRRLGFLENSRRLMRLKVQNT